MKRLIQLICLFACFGSLPALAEFKLPKYETYQLDNGLQVYLLQQSEVPLIDVRLVVKAGAVRDGKQYGLANLTAESLMFGSDKLTKAEVEDQLAFHGAVFNSRAGLELTALSLSIAKKDQRAMLKLFRDIALKPQFDAEEFTKYKTRYLSLLEQRRESPGRIINDLFAKLYYGDNPYGNPVGGDAQSVEPLALDQVKQFYRDYYTPGNAALVVVGDFKKKAMKKQINALFQHWKGSAPVPLPHQPIVEKSHSNVWLVNKEDAKETTFMIGGKGIHSSHPDFVAATVINTILGGRFTSWLNDELRVNTGLTYGARSRFVDHANSGSFVISTFTKTETTFEALDLALKTYAKLWQQGIDQATLDSAKAYVKGQFPPDYETSGQLADFLSKMWALGLDASLIDDFQQKVDKLDLEKANHLAKKLFPQQNLQIVLVGKAAKISKQAETYGEVTTMDIKTFSF